VTFLFREQWPEVIIRSPIAFFLEKRRWAKKNQYQAYDLDFNDFLPLIKKISKQKPRVFLKRQVVRMAPHLAATNLNPSWFYLSTFSKRK